MIRVMQVKLDVRKDDFESLKKKTIEKMGIKYKDLKDLMIVKKSIDARNSKNVFFSYEVDVTIENEEKFLKKNKNNDIKKIFEEKYVIPKNGNEELKNRPVVVGSGPCGLFTALILAEAGFKPIVIERGERIEDRINTVEEFWKRGVLNENSNVCFGEGGAGTFSDGKLNTLVDDKEQRMKKIFDTFIECGAPPEVSYENKPHVGTDVLKDVIINIRNKILSLGGEINYYSRLTDIKVVDNKIESIEINGNKNIDCNVLVLALGHSARDTIKMLFEHGIKMESKPFAIGVRVQHKQEMINKNQYGDYSDYLGPASYKLTHKLSNGRGIYTFCMCPGGYVVNSSCEKGHLIINGMSYNKRDGENANSAVIVTISKDDFGLNPLDGLEFQRRLEALAYRKGNGNIPIQLWKDYKENVLSSEFGNIKPMFKGKYTFADLNEIFPYYINESLKEGIEAFDKKIKGFASDDTILAGVESRTSSAVKFFRDENFESNIKGIYPSGEGAGYAGGIVTSAIDGIKTAEFIIKKYNKEVI